MTWCASSNGWHSCNLQICSASTATERRGEMADEPGRDDLLQREAAFDRYLSAAARGRLARPDPVRDQDLEGQLAATVRRVHALAGQPLPDPNRADRLWRNLMSGYAPTASLPFAPDFPRPSNGHGGVPRTRTRPVSHS